MANLAKFTGWRNRFGGKSNAADRNPDIFQNIKLLTLADDMTNTLIAMSVLGRRNLDHVQQVGIAVDSNDRLPVPD